MGAGEAYECPECGTAFGNDAARCPGCSVSLDWSGVEIRLIEESSDKVLSLVDPRLPYEGTDQEVEDAGATVCSPFGWTCMVLTVVAFLGTLVLLRWDTIIHGASEESIGSSQRLMVYTGLAATTVMAAFSILDIVRTQFGSRDA